MIGREDLIHSCFVHNVMVYEIKRISFSEYDQIIGREDIIHSCYASFMKTWFVIKPSDFQISCLNLCMLRFQASKSEFLTVIITQGIRLELSILLNGSAVQHFETNWKQWKQRAQWSREIQFDGLTRLIVTLTQKKIIEWSRNYITLLNMSFKGSLVLLDRQISVRIGLSSQPYVRVQILEWNWWRIIDIH